MNHDHRATKPISQNYCGKHSPIEAGGGGGGGGAEPHDAIPQQPAGSDALQLTPVSAASQLIAQRVGGRAPRSSGLCEACRKVRCGSAPSASTPVERAGEAVVGVEPDVAQRCERRKVD